MLGVSNGALRNGVPCAARSSSEGPHLLPDLWYDHITAALDKAPACRMNAFHFGMNAFHLLSASTDGLGMVKGALEYYLYEQVEVHCCQ